jgi:hypothetical protein
MSSVGIMINDDTFARMVAEEVKNKLSPSQRAILLEPQNWGRWKDALLMLIDNLDAQIENIKEDAEADADRYSSMGRSGEKLAREAAKAYQGKIIKIDRFKFHVNRRLDDVMMMIETGTQIKSDGWEQVEFFKRAIATHRQMLKEFDLEDTAVDRALWAALNNKWEFDDISGDSL